MRRIIEAVEEAGDEDQRASALFHALNHHKLGNYVGTICRTFRTETVPVGLQAVTGMEELVRMLTQERDRGGRSKQCNFMLQMIVICLVKGVDENENVLHWSIFFTVFQPLGRWATQRLMINAGKKRKRMTDQNWREFRAVDNDAKR